MIDEAEVLFPLREALVKYHSVIANSHHRVAVETCTSLDAMSLPAD